jgi:hypothetical protein
MDLYNTFMKNFDAEASKIGLVGTELAKNRPNLGEIDEETSKKNTKTPKDFLKDGITMKDILLLAKNKKMTTNKIKKEIQKHLKDNENVKDFLDSIKKQTSPSKSETKEAMVSGASVGMFDDNVFSKEEFKEGTSTASSGSYETNKVWAKSMNKKHWRNAKANYMPGSKRVQVKKKCKRFPYCNQGDINALNIFENEIGQKVIKNLSQQLGLSEQYIKNIIKLEINS